MKKILCMLFFVFGITVFATNTSQAKTAIKGDYLYEYTELSKGLCIKKIVPLAKVTKLEIPTKIKGKKVIELSGEDGDSDNIFGLEKLEETGDYTDESKEICKKLKKIKKVILPSTLKSISNACFSSFPSEKVTIFVPSRINNLSRWRVFNVKWKKVIDKSSGKEIKEKADLIISKDGKVLLGFTGEKKCLRIPKSVRTIKKMSYCGVKKIIIYKNVSKMEVPSFLEKGVKIKISKQNKIFSVKNNKVYRKGKKMFEF